LGLDEKSTDVGARHSSDAIFGAARDVRHDVQTFPCGNAARNGLLAALLAQRDFTSSSQSLEGPRVSRMCFATSRNFDEITAKLGETWEISVNSYKPFACASSSIR